jgi:hypothetical protein
VTEQSQFGPRIEDSVYRKFSKISSDSFALYHDGLKQVDENNLIMHFWARLAYYAESTSWSIKLLTSWEAALPAVALARIRLEQIIICSYLIHENTDIALGPYLKHLNAERFSYSKQAEQNPVLRNILDEIKEKELPGSKKIQEQLRENFSFRSISRKWTKLDLLSMAKKRDTLTKRLPNISHQPLELSYAAVYGTFSSLVHSGVAAFSNDFLARQFEPPKIGFKPQPFWSTYLVMTLSSWDILHVFELLTKMDVDREKELEELFNRFLKYRDEYFETVE